MTVLPIVTYPAKVLSRPARTIKPGDIDLHDLYGRMVEAMRVHVGVGLAAPQVDMGIRFVVAENTETGIKRGFANPRIIEYGSEKQIGPEGCLSFPGVYGRVVRSTRIRIRYQDLDFNNHEEEIEGFFARVLQHEIDHLNGVLLIDRADDGLHEYNEEEDEDAIEEGDADFEPITAENEPAAEHVSTPHPGGEAG